jgi:hypothetical protein
MDPFLFQWFRIFTTFPLKSFLSSRQNDSVLMIVAVIFFSNTVKYIEKYSTAGSKHTKANTKQ